MVNGNMKDDMSEEELLEYILENVPSLNRSDIERMVNEYIESLGISRKTALYLIFLEYRVAPETRGDHHLSLEELINGLSNVHLIVRLVWLSPTMKYKNGVLTRGGVMDHTMILPIVFWNRTVEDLKSLGIEKGIPIEIKGCYTRSNIQGDLEIHVPERAGIEPRFDMDNKIPKEDIFFKSIDQLKSDEPVFTYGILLNKPSSRQIIVDEAQRELHSFYIGYKDKAVRCTSWSEFPIELYSLSPGMPIRIYNGRGRINRFGEFEIRLTRASHIEPAYDLNITLEPREIMLNQVSNGFNLAKIYVKLVSYGVIRKRDGRRILNILIYDGEQEATLSVIDDQVDVFKEYSEGEEVYIEMFRASVKALFSTSTINIFTTEITKISRSDDQRLSFSIPTVNVKDIAMHNRYINIIGKIVSIKTSTENMDMNELIMEDKEGEPFTVLYRGDIKDYTYDNIGLGDEVKINTALVDLQSLLTRTPYSPLKMRLRAFSKIEKI